MSALGRMWSRFRAWQLHRAARWWEAEGSYHRDSCFRHRDAALQCARRADAKRHALRALQREEAAP